MPEFQKWLPGMFAIALLGFIEPAVAQHVVLDAPGILGTQKQAPTPAPARAPTAVWPRLDPGAVFCQTEDDLDRHAANMIARVGGGEMQTANCRAIAQTVGIKIISREGPGRTEVQIAGGETGWTDVWLPDKPPPR
jgi:hypothetical protein